MPKRRYGLTVAAVALMAAGAGLGAWYALAPQSLERVYGEVVIAAMSATASEVHTVRLEGEGGEAALDRCTGAFVEMTSYRVADIPPVHAAHNSCGGAQILAWDMGDLVKVEGREGLYRVIDERHTRKWAEVNSLVGMQGDFVLQTCEYGLQTMRFLGLELVPDDDPAASQH